MKFEVVGFHVYWNRDHEDRMTDFLGYGIWRTEHGQGTWVQVTDHEGTRVYRTYLKSDAEHTAGNLQEIFPTVIYRVMEMYKPRGSHALTALAGEGTIEAPRTRFDRILGD